MAQAPAFDSGGAAAAAKVHVNALGRVERGKGNPTLKVLWKIATKLKVTVAQLHLGPARE